MNDMWLSEAEDPRLQGGELTDERSVLEDYLNTYRLTLELKCQGLDPQQMATRPIASSLLSPLGLVRHMAFVEHTWFRTVMSGSDEPRPFSSPTDGDAEFTGAVADEAVVAEAWRVWREEVAFAEELVRGTDDLATLGTMANGETLMLREVLVHMIEEYARHCGHLDLVRELIDGRTGQ